MHLLINGQKPQLYLHPRVTTSKQTPTSQHGLAQIHCLAEHYFLRTGACCIILQAAPGRFVIQRLVGAEPCFPFPHWHDFILNRGLSPTPKHETLNTIMLQKVHIVK